MQLYRHNFTIKKGGTFHVRNDQYYEKKHFGIAGFKQFENEADNIRMRNAGSNYIRACDNELYFLVKSNNQYR